MSSIAGIAARFTEEQREAFFRQRQAGEVAPPTPRLLNPELARLVREIGHTDMLLLADMGFPTPVGVPCVDVALLPDVPTIPQVLTALEADGFHFDRMIITDEMRDASPERVSALTEQFPGTPIESHPHVEFKKLAAMARATIRTGDATPYANLILVCG